MNKKPYDYLWVASPADLYDGVREGESGCVSAPGGDPGRDAALNPEHPLSLVCLASINHEPEVLAT
jgi:hypothetical protein